jgi:DNA processing protein
MKFDYSNYFNRLSEYEKIHAPQELFLEGDPELLVKGIRVSVVGTRNPTEKGILRAIQLTKALVEQNIIVVSGLAEGIDAIAHRTCIENGGKTIAVLGTPLSIAYPTKNKSLLDLIKKEHLSISQFSENYPVQKKNFPMRNRTMALISDATIIVEAGETSGTIHQGWEALRLGRLLFLLNSVVDNADLTWPQKMINYGAQRLGKDNLSSILKKIPCFTEIIEAV